MLIWRNEIWRNEIWRNQIWRNQIWRNQIGWRLLGGGRQAADQVDNKAAEVKSAFG